MLSACGDSTAPERTQFSYEVTPAGSATSYHGGNASFTLAPDPCVAGASLLSIDMLTAEGARLTLALRLGKDGGPTEGVYPFSIARLPGVAGVLFSDVSPIPAFTGRLSFLRLTGELRLSETSMSRITGSFVLEAVNSLGSPVDVRGTFDAGVDSDPETVPVNCELPQVPAWPHRIDPAIITADARGSPSVEVDMLGTSAVIGIRVGGVTGCHAIAETEVVVEGLTATITPRNYNSTGTGGCPKALANRVATAVVAFGRSGEAVIRVRGLSEAAGTDTIVVERSVTVP